MARTPQGPPRGGPPHIPDHDGRPLDPEARRELRSRLAYIDQVYGGSYFRRVFRALAYRHFGDEVGEAREMGALAMEAGYHHGLSDREVDRLTMPATMYLNRRRRGWN